MDIRWITAVNGCMAGGHAAVEDGGTGTGIDAGVDTAFVNDAMIVIATKLLCGDVIAGVS